MGSNSIPPKTLSDESINRGLVCAHMHFIARTQKILTLCPRRVNAGNKNTPSTHHPRRQNVNGWIEKGSHTQKSHPKMMNPRDIAGERTKKQKKKKKKKISSDQYSREKSPLWRFHKKAPFDADLHSNIYALVSCKIGIMVDSSIV